MRRWRRDELSRAQLAYLDGMTEIGEPVVDAAQRCRDLGNEAELPLHLGIHAGDVVNQDEPSVTGVLFHLASQFLAELALQRRSVLPKQSTALRAAGVASSGRRPARLGNSRLPLQLQLLMVVAAISG